jgi:hypothetical protein
MRGKGIVITLLKQRSMIFILYLFWDSVGFLKDSTRCLFVTGVSIRFVFGIQQLIDGTKECSHLG